MTRKNSFRAAIILGILLFSGMHQAIALDTIELEVNSAVRTAEIYIPDGERSSPMPVVIAFHGHGGTMKTAAVRFEIEKYWPDAIVIYPQGVPTPSDLVDPEGRYSGWQKAVHDQSGRDIAFFDSLMEYIAKRYPVDPKRIYVTGFSNGAIFTYVLWAARGNLLAAIAPIAGILPEKEDREQLQPKPAFIVAGRQDPIAKFAWQNAMIDYIKTLNGCTHESRRVNEYMIEYPSFTGTPLITYINDAGHEIPKEALPYIVSFFKEHELL